MLLQNEDLHNYLKKAGIPISETVCIKGSTSRLPKEGWKAKFARCWHTHKFQMRQRFPNDEAYMEHLEEQGWRIYRTPDRVYENLTFMGHYIIEGIQKEFPQANHSSIITKPPYPERTFYVSYNKPRKAEIWGEDEYFTDQVAKLQTFSEEIEMRWFMWPFDHPSIFREKIQVYFSIGYSRLYDTLYIQVD